MAVRFGQQLTLKDSGDDLRRPSVSAPPPYRSSRENSPGVESHGLSETCAMLPLPGSSAAVAEPFQAGSFKMLGNVGFVPGWEGLRGVAVALVMVSHVIEHREMVGTHGVGIFFVLSGFLITGVVLNKAEQSDQTQEASTTTTTTTTNTTSSPRRLSLDRFAFIPGFYMDRFVRLTPALVLMVAICWKVGVYLGKPPDITRTDALAALFYMHNMYPTMPEDPRLMFPGVFCNTWSLAVEEQFYIFWSLLIPFVIPLSLKNRAMVMAFLVFGGYWIRWYSGWNFLGGNMHAIDYRYSWCANAWKMFIGCAARLLPVPEVLTRKWMGTVSTLFFFGLTYMWSISLPNGGTFDFRTSGAWLELFTCFATLVVIISSINGNRILESKLFRFPGRISYSWYLWQFPVHALHGWPVGDWGPTAIAFVIATFTTFMIEEPIRERYHACKTRHQAATQDATEKQTSRRQD